LFSIILQQPPLVNLDQKKKSENGTTVNMVKVLAAKMNFTVQFVREYNSITLGNKKDGKWTGMLKRVVDGEVMFAANGFWKTKNSLEDVYFTFPFNEEVLGMMLQKTSEDHKYLFLTPFKWDVSDFHINKFFHLILSVHLDLGLYLCNCGYNGACALDCSSFK